MEKLSGKRSFARIETTIGELIEAVTQMAMETGSNEQEGYHLASLALGTILTASNQIVPETL